MGDRDVTPASLAGPEEPPHGDAPHPAPSSAGISVSPEVPPRPTNRILTSPDSSAEGSYANLSYAPRQPSSRISAARRPNSFLSAQEGTSTLGASVQQLPDRFEASQTVFTSHSTLFADQQVKAEEADAAVPSTATTAAAQPTATDKAPQTTASTLAYCESLGLSVQSPGYALIQRLCEGTEGEWKHLADLVGDGEAVLLLPRSSRSFSSSSSTKREEGLADDTDGPFPPPSLAFAHDHVLIAAAGRPSGPDVGPASKGCATLSGLRTVIEGEAPAKKLIVRSFICRKDRSWPAELRNKGTRRRLFASLPALPQPCCSDYPLPNYSIQDAGEVELPPRLSPRNVGNASLSGLSSDSSRSRAMSASNFAALLVGSGREKRKNLLTVSDQGTDSSLGATQEEQTKIHFMIIDRPVRRPRALRGMTYSIKARLLAQLERQVGIAGPAAEMVGSFASSFFPPAESSSAAVLRRQRSEASLAGSAPACMLYAASPDDLQALFQDLYANVQEALETTSSMGGMPADEADAAKWQQMEAVEALLLRELYDRVFSPAHSTDAELDAILASRVAAFNVLNLDWESLGLHFPTDDAGRDARSAMEDILSRCEVEIAKLLTPEYYSPKSKLEVLVAVHRLIVEGLANAPPIQLRESSDERASNRGEHRAEAGEIANSADDMSVSEQRPSNTSSADLILPVLIRLLVRTNPPGMASQLLYTQRFRNERLLNREGESAYCLINFQAAIKFIENARPGELGLDQGQDIAFEPATPKGAAMEVLQSVVADQASPGRRGPLQADPSSSVGVAGRVRGLSTVVNSSFSVLGKVIGTGASAGMEAWDRSSKNIDGMRTLDDIRKLLSSGPRVADSPVKGGDKSLKSGLNQPQGGTDYSSAEEQRRDAIPGINLVNATASKPTLSDRLAHLNRKLMSGSPGSTESPLAGVSVAGSASSHTSAAPVTLMPSAPLMSRPKLTSKGTAGTITSNHTSAASALGLVHLSNGDDDNVVEATAAMQPVPASLRSPYPTLSRPPTQHRPLHVVLASSGSVASVKIPLIVEKLLSFANVRVQVIATKASLHFYTAERIRQLNTSPRGAGLSPVTPEATTISSSVYSVAHLAAENLAASRASGDVAASRPNDVPRAHLWTDEDEWRDWKQVGDPILHIELRRWADIVLVAPCSANTLAKIAGGLCDDLLTSFLRALSPETPTLVFPAMNTLMYRHPLTAAQLSILSGVLGYEIHGPIEKRLACGDVGAGAMLEWSDIVELVRDKYGLVVGGETSHVATPEEENRTVPAPKAVDAAVET
ncbi:unnamed protein product [Parajaminaea phylloscopi]